MEIGDFSKFPLQLVVFLTMFGFSVVFVILVFLLGEIVEGVGHAFDGIFDFLHIDFFHFDAHGDHPGASTGLYSFKAVLVFVIVFSGVGALVTLQGYGALGSTLSGIVSGLIFASAYGYFARLLYRQQSTSVVSDQSIVGKVGTLTTGVPTDGVGQVMLSLDTGNILKTARSDAPIPGGSKVRVVSVVGGDAFVEKALP